MLFRLMATRYNAKPQNATEMPGIPKDTRLREGLLTQRRRPFSLYSRDDVQKLLANYILIMYIVRVRLLCLRGGECERMNDRNDIQQHEGGENT